MNNPNVKLKNLIYVEKSAIPSEICDYVVYQIKNKTWGQHTWYNPIENSVTSEKTLEPEILNCPSFLQEKLEPFITKSIINYNNKFSFYKCDRTKEIISRFSKLRFNRYQKNQIMRQHMDHIQSLFDGNQKGIPVLSIILNLNSDYRGGDLYFWDNYILKLKKGDIVIFPSLFLFPHGVKEVTDGVRYSCVCWGW